MQFNSWIIQLQKMSLRQLRRLELQGTAAEGNEKDSDAHVELSDESRDDSIPKLPVNSRRSVFLEASGSDFQVSDAESACEDTAKPDAAAFHSASSSQFNASSREAAGAAARRRVGKARKRRTKTAQPAAVQEDHKHRSSTSAEPEEDVEFAASGTAESPKDSAVESCLSMERSAFDPELDLKRMFGREVLRRARSAGRGSAGEHSAIFLMYFCVLVSATFNILPSDVCCMSK